MKFPWKISDKPKPEPVLIYAPKDDITVFELSQALKAFAYNGKYSTGLWEHFPPEVKRHFYIRNV